jgi:AraC-like DNA-binding protein
MLCTSRLLYILSCARSLFPTPDLNLVACYRDLEPCLVVERLLGFMLDLDPDHPGWWGVSEEPRITHAESLTSPQTIKSADYVAWAIRALAFTLPVISDTSTFGDNTWENRISVETRKKMRAILRELLQRLVQDKTTSTLLSESAEEPHPYILGELATTYLVLQDLHERYPSLRMLDGLDLSEHAQRLKEAVEELGFKRQPHLSRFFIWPALVFLHRSGILNSDERACYALDMATTLQDCVHSSIWIRQGGGTGSWGNNLENTQRIVSSLNTFWRYAYKDEQNTGMFEDLCTRARSTQR